MSVDIRTHRLKGRDGGPHLVILGGIHGDEFEPMEAIRWLVDELPSYELTGSVTLVPVVNEPAFLRGQRTADDGLDLARTFPGRRDGSVTEQIAFQATEIIRSADAVVDLHTGGTQLSVLPLTGYMLHENPDVLAIQRRMAQAFNLPIVWGTSSELDGRSLSVCRDANIPAIYAEYFGGGICRPDGVVAYVDGCLNIMRLLQMIERPTAPSHVTTCHEDPRPESGHMQICHPAPRTGYFAAAAALGQQIQRGEALGTICDTLGDVRETVFAERTGQVVVLRTFPRVLEGDGLAVILEP